jgi:mycobactin peptide synthetase MbtE
MQHIFQPALLDAFTRHETAIAMYDGQQDISFKVLQSLSFQVAARLLQDEARGAAIGILTASRTAMISSITGASLSGNVFVPLDSNLPVQRLASMIKVAGIKTVLYKSCDETLAALKEALAGEELVFADWDEVADASVEAACPELPAFSGSDSLYIYFTSGSTGVPKAVLGRNASLVQFLQWEIRQFNIEKGARFSQLVNPGFDAFLRDVFVPLLSGGVIVVPEKPTDVISEEQLAAWINAAKINYVHCVPSVFRLVSNKLENEHQFAELKAVFLSGEKILPVELKKWYDTLGSRVQLYNFYGTTETTMIRSFYAIQPGDVQLQRLPVGRPIADTNLYVLKSDGATCELLEEGDVYISSPFVTKGYWKDGAIDNSIFREDSETPGYFMYFTGDRGRLLANGDLEVLGRADDQLKIRGVRIEPGEIESLLLASEGVKEAAVYLTAVNGQPVLAAAVVLKDGQAAGENALSSYLNASLPANMVPGKWLIVNALPRLANGKLDRPALTTLQPASAEASASPMSETEQVIFDIWSGIIKNQDFTKTNTFFEVGGNSFHLISLVAKIHGKYGIRLSIKDIFQHNTVEKMAAFLGQKKGGEKMAVPKAEKAEFYNLSGGQFQVFHQQYLYEGSTAYNLPQFFIIDGDVDVERMKKVMEQLVAHHSTLRTGFTIKEGVPVQYVVENAVPEFEYRERTGITEDEQALMAQQFVRPFDLNRPPLFRAALVKRAEGSYLLMTDVHHIAADGFSQMMLNRDIALLYAGKPLTSSKLEYTDFAEWQYRERTSSRLKKQEEYWVNKLTPLPRPVQLPAYTLTVEENNQEGALFEFSLDKDTTQKIKKLVKDKDTTVFVFLMSVYNILLSKLGMQEDITVGTAVDGRSMPGLENIAGMFVNTLVIRNKVESDRSFTIFLDKVKESVMGALDNQDLPYEEVVNKLKASQSVRSNLFNVMLVYLNMEVPTEFDSKGIRPYTYKTKTSKFDMTLTGFEVNGEIRVKMEYSTQVFFEGQVEKIASYFTEITQQALNDQNVMLGDIVLQHNLEAINYEVSSFEFNF